MAKIAGGRILVVDDHESARFARSKALRDAKHVVFEAGCLKDAQVLLREMRPELVVLDVLQQRRAACLIVATQNVMLVVDFDTTERQGLMHRSCSEPRL